MNLVGMPKRTLISGWAALMCSFAMLVSPPTALSQTAPNFATTRVFPVGPDPQIDYCPYGLAVADVDNDGDLDVVVAAVEDCGKGGHVRVYRNTPQCWGSRDCIDPFSQIDDYVCDFVCPVSNSSGVEDEDRCALTKLAFANLHLTPDDAPDGFMDLAITVPTANLVCILKNNGDVPPPDRGRFSEWAGSPILLDLGNGGALPMDILAGKWDYAASGDDLAVASRWKQSGTGTLRPRLAVLNSDGSGGFTEHDVDLTGELGRGWELDGYGQVTGNAGAAPVTILFMSNPDFARMHRFSSIFGIFTHQGSDTSVRSKGLTISLFTDDLLYDVVTTRWPATQIQVRWLLGQSNGSFSLQPNLDNVALGPHGTDSGPVNRNDNWFDVVVVSESSDQVFVLVNNSGSTANLFVDPAYSFPLGVTNAGSRQVILADLNNDGYLDIITSNWNDSTISVLINIP